MVFDSLNSFWVLKGCFNKRGCNFDMMLAKLAKYMPFYNKDILKPTFLSMTSPTEVYQVTQIVDVLMWPKLSNSGISVREVIINSIL